MNTSSLYLPFLAPHCTLQKNNREFENCNFFEICQSARFLVKSQTPARSPQPFEVVWIVRAPAGSPRLDDATPGRNFPSPSPTKSSP